MPNAFFRILGCLSQLYVKDTTLNDKQELGEDFDRDVSTNDGE